MPTRAPDRRRSQQRVVKHRLDRDAPFYIAGHRGLAGSALVRRLTAAGFTRIIERASAQLDLRDRDAVFDFFAETRPTYVALAAAKVRGILANSTTPVDFLGENLRIQVNVLDAAREMKVPRLLFVGSSCAYPKFAEQPIREDSMLTGPLEPTHHAYAIAKIAGVVQIQAVRRQYGLPWISVMPTNLYGPNDNFHPTSSHVLPALIRRYDDAVLSRAPAVTNWGSGLPRRDFVHADDMADACLHLLENYDGAEPVNVGSGTDVTIREVADIVASAVGYTGETRWDGCQPEGSSRRLLDVSRLSATGWTTAITLRQGIESTVAWYQRHVR